MSIDVEDMYRRYGSMVHRRCQRLLGNPDEAADAMHDVFVLLVRRRERLEARSAPALLYKISTDVCLNRLRTRRRKPETRDETLLQFIASNEELDKMTEHRSMLDRIFKKELPSTRTIAVLHYVDGMTLQEVSEVVGLSVSGVRKRLRQLKERAGELQEVIHG